MGDYQNKTWPEKLRLSDMYVSEIIDWMQDFEQLDSEYPDTRGHYVREDLHAATIAERDALRAELSSGSFYKEADIDAMQDQITALRAEVERLREALRPFSEEATYWFERNYSASDMPVEGFSDYHGVMTCGDLFKARAALGDQET